MAELLIFPALLAYGEAVVAYAGELRGGPGRAGRLGTWGVRVGWLAQTALLAAQVLTSDGFPWATWAGALNLFVWLVVGVYLIWGCRPRYRLLGLAVMPPAAALLVVAWAGGGTGIDAPADSDVLLAIHAGLMLAGLAGLTVAGGMAALYVWEERRLKRRDAGVFRLRLPPLEALDRLSARVALMGLGLLTAGVGVGLTTLERRDVDAAMAVTIVILAVHAGAALLRREGLLHGRRAAWLQLAGLVLVAIVLPITHFAS
jgi:ABC-type uncharacterized transport system permease subunit